ncbi:MAG: LPP20 family lipoprotein [Bacteroidales bacterium]
MRENIISGTTTLNYKRIIQWVLSVLLSCLIFSGNIYGQSVSEIKSQRDKYLWGEGTGTTLSEADKNALSMLVSQISTKVESKFEQFKQEVEKNDNIDYSEKVNSVVNTYSEATLHNTERIVVSNEPDAEVFRYIRRENVEKVFENRKDKIFDFVENAQKAVKKRRIGDGLRYYYWAFTLLKSHPDCNDIRYTDENGEKHLLINWIPMQMDRVFSNIKFQVKKEEDNENSKRVILHVVYKDDPVTNLDYSYWDGQDWSNLINVKDGRGFLEYYGAAAEGKEEGRIKVEYIHENRANIDNELKTVLEKIDAVPFRESYFNISFEEKQTQTASKKEDKKKESDISSVEDPSGCREVLARVEKAIRKKDYDAVKNSFTERGFEMYQKLIAYGKAELLAEPEYSFFRFRDEIMVRSLLMSFSFKDNQQEFVEDVVFHFNKDEKIKSISFGLSQDALKSIINKKVWDEIDRMVLINFLEHYKTAYALERLDYIESIFADDALIITGYVVETNNSVENQYQDNKIVRYNRQTKQEYIRNLRHCFKSKEFINIQFEENEVRKGGKGGDIYGVKIKQNYYSSNYGDQGWLFLMVDLNEPKKPVIHVRTWQPTKEQHDSIYGLEDF